MQNFLGTILGKFVRLLITVRKTGGHALPGLIVETVFPNYLSSMLNKLPGGVVIITGTNGKTTTTKIVVELLRANGFRVITNPTGSNMTRGIASGLVRQAKPSGKLPYDIAVFEVDEASTKPLINKVRPRWTLALNVSRDQLDRFGEVDKIASLVGAAMKAATQGAIVNANDPQLAKIAAQLASGDKTSVKYFAVADNLRKFFPSDYDLASVDKPVSSLTNVPKESIIVELTDFDAQSATYTIDGQRFSSHFSLTGQHNFQNAAAAISLVKQLLPSPRDGQLVEHASKVKIAFGRGESYSLPNGCVVELVLVKNPASFRQGLASYAAGDEQLMIAINDNIADGRDVSWLWDVSFLPLAGKKIDLTSGSRAADIALRLDYDDIEVLAIEPDLNKALGLLSKTPGRKVIFATYTAMLHLHGNLTKKSVSKL